MGLPLRSLNDYFRRLNDLLSGESWELSEEASKLLSIGDAHVQLKFLQVIFQIPPYVNIPAAAGYNHCMNSQFNVSVKGDIFLE